MEGTQGCIKALKIAAVDFSRIVQSTKVHGLDGVQRIKMELNSASVLALIPFRPKLVLRSKEMAIMGKLFSGLQVLVPEVLCKIVRCKSNQVLNTVRYRSLRRSAALLLRAG